MSKFQGMRGAGAFLISMSLIASAANAQAFDLNLPAQSLARSLQALGSRTGVNIAFDPRTVEGRVAPALQGTFSSEQALEALLRGSGLTVRRTEGGSLLIVRNEASPPVKRIAMNNAKPSVSRSSEPAPVAESPVQADIGDIVVTAQGRIERLQDVPLSASVVGGDTIAKAGITNLVDLGSRISNVKITGGPASDQIHVRGVGTGLNGGLEQSVPTFVDGMYRGRSRVVRAALFDVERVEILKGPQTTFFGNNAIAGALNVSTRKPGDAFEYNASASAAPRDGQFELEVGATVPLTPSLSVRGAFKYYGINGYVYDEVANDKFPHSRDWIGRVSLAWTPSADFRSDLRFDRGRNRDTGSFPNELIGCPRDTAIYGTTPFNICTRYLTANGGVVDDHLDRRRAGPPSYFNNDFWELAWTNALTLGRHTFTSRTGYYHHKLVNAASLIPAPLIGNGGLPQLLSFINPEKYHNFSQEVRLASPLGTGFEYILGAYYSHGKLQSDSASSFYFLPILPPRTAGLILWEQKDSIYSAFASGTWHVSSRLRLNGALRYSVVDKEAHRQNAIGSSTTLFPNEDDFTPYPLAQQATIRAVLGGQAGDFADPTRIDKKLMPSVSAQYDVTDDMMTYASFSKGFKAGAFGEASTADVLEPENVDAYEIGLKGKFLDRRLTLNLAAFWSEYSDMQEATGQFLPSGTIIVVFGNAGKSRSRGFEMGGQFRASDILSFNFDMAYLDAKYTKFPLGPCTIAQSNPPGVPPLANCRQDLAGKRRAFAPEWSGNVGLSLQLPIDFENRISIEPSVFFTSKYFQQANADPLFVQPGYAKIDMRIAFGPRDRRWEFAILGKNLTDKQTANFRNAVGTAPGTTYAVADRPRAIAFQFSVRR